MIPEKGKETYIVLENINISSCFAEENMQVRIQWRWKYDNGEQLPYCKVFCCKISANQILRDSIFREDEILSWVNYHLVNLSADENRQSRIEDFVKNPANGERCSLRTFQLKSGGNISESQVINLAEQDVNTLFLVCVYGQRSFEVRVLPIIPPKTKLHEVVTTRSLFGKKKHKLRVNDDLPMRKVLVTQSGGSKIYSVIPAGSQELFIDEELTPERIDDVVYLSSLIGS